MVLYATEKGEHAALIIRMEISRVLALRRT